MLSIDIDEGKISDISREFGATEKQVRYAYSKALTRTAGTLRKIATSGIKTELGLKNAKLLRQRIKLRKRKGANSASATIWVGTRDMPYSDFKGRRTKTETGVRVGDDLIHGGFVGTSVFTGRKEIFKRKGRQSHPIVLVGKPIHERVVTYLEDNVYVDI